jgi:hypothetical protein
LRIDFYKSILHIQMKPFLMLALSLALVVTLSVYAGTGQNVGGHAWSSNVGWIKLNNCTDPQNSSTCASPTDYGVSFASTDPGTGSGMAWSSNIGWISFGNTGCPSGAVPGCTGGTYADWANPNTDGSVNIKGWARACSVYVSGCSGTEKVASNTGAWDGYIALKDPTGSSFGVKINTDKTMTGYAWGSDVVGWVQFTGLIRVTDVCPNITGNQSSIPSGMVIDGSGNCVNAPDVCPNIAGTQTSVPSGMVIDGSGNCVNTPTDVCPNIAGTQTSVPSGMVIDGSGNCVNAGGDVCPNIPGTQTSVPNGMKIDGNGDCTGPNGDMCLNRNGIQLTIPSNTTVDANGNCRTNPIFIER